MVGVCCGCIAKPASVQPRKTYNILIKDLFSGEPIGVHDSLDSSLRRKIQKLQEYSQKNPAKIPKVSRRLRRHLEAVLRKPGDNLGVVKVSVYAYIYLLAKSLDETSSYSSSFFATELVSAPDAVVPVLLRHPNLELRTLGAELLGVFTRVQGEADNQLEAIQGMTPAVCRAARSALQADRAGQKVAETLERRKAGDTLAVPNPLDLIARKDPARVAALEAACLRGLQAVVGLCQQQRLLPQHLDQVTAVMLDNLGSNAAVLDGKPLRHNGHAAGAGLSGTPAATATSTSSGPASSAAATDGLHPSSSVQPQGSGTTITSTTSGAATAAAGGAGPASTSTTILDPHFYNAMGLAELDSGDASPAALAGVLLQQLGVFTQDVASVQDVLATFYTYLDERHGWQQPGLTGAITGMLSICGPRHAFPIFNSLLRHAGSRRLSPWEAARVLELAVEAGAGLEQGYSLSALALALAALPRVWAEQAQRSPKQVNLQTFLDLFKVGGRPSAAGGGAISSDCGSPSPRVSLAAPAATASTATTAAAISAAEKGSAGALATSSLPAGSTAAVAGSDVSTSNSMQLSYPQQLAALKDVILSGIRALAERVTSAAELAEALCVVVRPPAAPRWSASGFASAAATAGCSSAGGGLQGDAAVATSSPTAAAALTAGTTLGKAKPAGAAPGTPTSVAAVAGSTEGNPQVAEAAAALAVECAAAAVAAAPCCKAAAAPEQRALVGGVLPARLLAAAIPLLVRWPLVLRRGLYEVLAAFLPGAPKGVGDDRSAAALVPLLAAELTRLCSEDVTRDDVTPRLVVALDGLMRAAVTGSGSRPAVLLLLAQALLRWGPGEGLGGWAAALCTQQPWRGAAAVLLANSWLQLLAGAAEVPQLAQQQLPLQGVTHLALGPSGLAVVNHGPAPTSPTHAGTAGGSGSLVITQAHQHEAAAELARLDQKLAELGAYIPVSKPSAAEGAAQGAGSSGAAKAAEEEGHGGVAGGWEATLRSAPVLQAAYGTQLPQLLREGAGHRRSNSLDSLPSAASKQQLADKMNSLFLKRMGTLRRDLVHVSELMRDSLTRISEPPPPLAALLSHTRTSSTGGPGSPAAGGLGSVQESHPSAAAGPPPPAAAAAEQGGGPHGEAARLGVGRPASPVPAAAPLTLGAADIAANVAPSAAATPAGASPMASPRDVQLAVHGGPAGGMSAKAAAAAAAAGGWSPDQAKMGQVTRSVMDVLKKAIAAAADHEQFVVGNVQISQLAAEVEPMASLQA